jgi:hypothetical protein
MEREKDRDREDKKSLESFDANAQLAMHKGPSEKMRKMEEMEKGKNEVRRRWEGRWKLGDVWIELCGMEEV